MFETYDRFLSRFFSDYERIDHKWQFANQNRSQLFGFVCSLASVLISSIKRDKVEYWANQTALPYFAGSSKAF